MDAVEFLRDFRRMCSSYDDCTGCELRSDDCIPTEEVCDHKKSDSCSRKMGERASGENAVVGVFEAVSKCIGDTNRRLSGFMHQKF